MNLATVEKIAAAILYEGYLLYPYRASAIKNRQRWNFGTLYPKEYGEAQRPQESFRFIAECLIIPVEHASLEVKVSFLQLVPKPTTTHDDLHTLADPSLEWNEAVEQAYQSIKQDISSLIIAPVTLKVETTPELQATLTVHATALNSGACRLRFELQNNSPLTSGASARREEALPLSLVSAHLLLGLEGGECVSLLDPPEFLRSDARACTNIGVFPVLAGHEPDRSMMLVSPIILYDYPQTAPESVGDFFDGTEMDEMLMLRVLTLADEEKEEMRAGDSRARRILERTEAMTGKQRMEAHGVIRQLRELRPLAEETVHES